MFIIQARHYLEYHVIHVCIVGLLYNEDIVKVDPPAPETPAMALIAWLLSIIPSYKDLLG